MNVFRCPSCGHQSKFPPQHAGKIAACPKCEHRSQLPQLASTSRSAENPGSSPRAETSTRGAWPGLFIREVIVLTDNALMRGEFPRQNLATLHDEVCRGKDPRARFENPPSIIPLSAVRWIECSEKEPCGFEVAWTEGREKKTEQLIFDDAEKGQSFLDALQRGACRNWTRQTIPNWASIRTDIGVGAFLSVFVLIVGMVAYGISSDAKGFERELDQGMSIKKFIFALLLFIVGKVLGPIGLFLLCGGVIGYLVWWTVRNCRSATIFLRLTNGGK